MPETTEWTLRVDEVTKIFDNEVRANDGLSLHVEPGEIYGLLGPNGAGKTTLVKQIIGLLKPDSGSIRLGPYDLVADPDAARQLCSYLPQAQMPISSFRAREAIEIMAKGAGSSVEDFNKMLADTDLFVDKKKSADFLEGGTIKATMTKVKKFSFDHDLIKNDKFTIGFGKDAKDLLDKYISKWTAEKGISNYRTGKKDVTCELFLDFIVFDEYTCRAEASVCW